MKQTVEEEHNKENLSANEWMISISALNNILKLAIAIVVVKLTKNVSLSLF